MARVLIAGGGRRGGELAGALMGDGLAVRVVVSGDPQAPLVPDGAERFSGEPDRPATLKWALEQVSAVCWLFGCAEGPPERVAGMHGPILRSFLEQTIDSCVRGLVYEGAGCAPSGVLAAGRGLVERVATTNAIPLAVLGTDPHQRPAWLAQARAAVHGLLGTGLLGTGTHALS